MNFNIQKIDSFTGHRDCIYTLSEGLNPTSFFSAGADGMVVNWSTLNPDLGKPFVKVQNSIYSILHKKENKEFWVANNFEGIHLINTDTFEEMGSLKLGNASFFDIKMYQNQLFIGDSLGQIHIVQKETLSLKKQLKASEKSVRSIAINENTGEMAVAYSDWLIRVFDLDTYKLKFVLKGHKNSVFTIKYINNGKTLVSGSRDAHLIVWDAENNYNLQLDIPAHLYAINDIIYLEGLNLLASCSMDKSIKLWNVDNMKLVKVIDKARHVGHATSINKLLWTYETQTLLSASDDRTISMWKLF